ncbi:MAG: hydroxymethylglutaryl-CoA lyase [Flavobacteriia bacterium]|jgi:hydroxymethylglutaryl-CoA lyase|nr:hydroxymethylglutaryl-CoA lyase [Cryomorphaceae bacterium]
MSDVKIIECPRDAMQGIHDFIPTDVKAGYINRILKCGFDTVDFGSFVSPKAIPQMRDTSEVLSKLELNETTKLLAIIANERGAEDACSFDEINVLGFPFSISETFQQRNTNSSREESLGRIGKISELCTRKNKELVVYLSMGFGNPYGDEWNPNTIAEWGSILYNRFDIRILALSDTIGAATPELVKEVFENISSKLPNVEFGAHLHTLPSNAKEITEAAYNAGCRRFDGAIKGFGGCPMANDDLTGNMPTELMLEWFDQHEIATGINQAYFNAAMYYAGNVFPV